VERFSHDLRSTMRARELFSVENKVALVTGAAGGIGRAIAELYAELGGKVVASDINEDMLDSVVKSLLEKGYSVDGYRADITRVEDVRELLMFVRKRHGGIDALYILPAINIRKTIQKYSYEEFDRIINVNLRGSFILLKESLPYMREGGSIVLFSSIRSLTVEPGQGPYAATKAALVQLARTAAAEYGKQGIRVNVIAPGVVDTPLTQQIKKDPEWYRAYVEKTILKRWADPREIASVAVFLSMPASSYITGSVIYVDGGWTAIDGRYEPNI
jgi:NAD(P)-dependent dehydrogenase (short-subunit alcohol dehydrogenase family)